MKTIWFNRLTRAYLRTTSKHGPAFTATPKRPEEVMLPMLEALEPRWLLSGSINVQFDNVDNSTALTGYVTSDIEVTSTTDWTGASLLLTIRPGSIYQDPAGGNTAPDPGLFASSPALPFDTYIGGDVASLTITGPSANLGSKRFLYHNDSLFNSKDLDIEWTNSSSNDIGKIDIGRITLSDDAVGDWSLFLTAEKYGHATYSGKIKDGSFSITSPPSIPAQTVDSDFSGDGHADLFWHNKRNGRNAIWIMNEGRRMEKVDVRSFKNTDWKLVGTGDFTGDGNIDVLWRNARNGRNLVWEFDGTAFVSKHAIKKQRNLEWRIAGVGDFTGDDKQDILWRHTSSGANSIWEMDGLAFQRNTSIKPVTNPNWWVAGVADFTGDGKDDIFWQDQKKKIRKVIWEMDGTDFQHKVDYAPHTRPLMDIMGFADMNYDGIADLLWRGPREPGGNSFWSFDSDLRGGGITGIADQDWQLAGSLALRSELI